MTSSTLTSRLAAAVADETSGATEIVRQVIDGLLALADDPVRLRCAADLLADQLPWCAPMWHVVAAARADRPTLALGTLRRRLDVDVERSIATAVRLLSARGCTVRTAPGSSLVRAVLAALPESGPRSGSAPGVVGLAGVDGLGSTELLNITGTRELAETVPTIVVATSAKLVPDEAFAGMGAPGFERVPLALFESVVLDGEVVTPAEAGRRAAALAPSRPSAQMTALGIVQAGADVLRVPAARFELPRDGDDARGVLAELTSALHRVAQVHPFAKGAGLAAPQIGIGRSAALVRTPDGTIITLLNPRIVARSSTMDERYEGCLSFFDVRGLTPRPLAIEVEYQEIDGTTRVASFENGVARLVAHEVDHLDGILYTAHMRPGVQPIPVSQYEDIGRRWEYHEADRVG